MPWIKLDDHWMDHPKIVRAGRDARDMWLASITWCAKHLTDGYFPAELLPSLAVSAGVDVANCQTFAKTLLDVCLWEVEENQYHIHDYLEYNPTKEQAEATRLARAAAGKAGGLAKSKQRPSKLLSKTPSKAVAKVKQKSAPYPYPYPLTEKPPAPDGASIFEVPAPLNIPVFLKAWSDWIKYRLEIKHKLTESTASKQLAMLAKHTPEIAAEMLNQSIVQGWQGIFELKPGNGSSPAHTPVESY